uniref:Zinc finger protein 710 n=1 Tax=Cacopsylla melanoneura TaxID=428564 RepID=A0A8D8XJN9_9HEMI
MSRDLPAAISRIGVDEESNPSSEGSSNTGLEAKIKQEALQNPCYVLIKKEPVNLSHISHHTEERNKNNARTKTKSSRDLLNFEEPPNCNSAPTKKAETKVQNLDYVIKNIKFKVENPTNCETENQTFKAKKLHSKIENPNCKTENETFKAKKVNNSRTKKDKSKRKKKKKPKMIRNIEFKIENLPKNSEGRFQCDQCESSYKLKGDFKTHLLKHKGVRHMCHLCSKPFTEKSALRQHVVQIHVGIRHDCNLCWKSFSCKAYLKKHKLLHERKAHQCHLCMKICLDDVRLQRHLIKHAGENGRYSCNQCEMSFTLKGNLKRHYRIHDNPEVKFQCTDCSASFSTSYNLDRHLLKHKGVRFPCEFCSKTFSLDSTLKKHILHFHEGQEMETYECSKCTMVYKSKHNLQRHILKRACDKRTINGIYLSSNKRAKVEYEIGNIRADNNGIIEDDDDDENSGPCAVLGVDWGITLDYNAVLQQQLEITNTNTENTEISEDFDSVLQKELDIANTNTDNTDISEEYDNSVLQNEQEIENTNSDNSEITRGHDLPCFSLFYAMCTF